MGKRGSSVRHRSRQQVCAADSVHVTLKVCVDVPDLRTPAARDVLEACLVAAKWRFGMNVAHYVVMDNHFHLIVVAKSKESLARGMQGLTIRLARAINRFFNRKGKVFVERYHSRSMRRRIQVRRAVRYVLQNARRHGIPIPKGKWDPYSSARFNKSLTTDPEETWPVVRPAPRHATEWASLILQVDDLPAVYC